MAKIVDADINSRISEICDKVFGGNVTLMAKGTFIKRTTILSIIGDQQSAPGYDVLRRIVEMKSVNINETWLLTGQGSMLNDDKSSGVPYYDEDFMLGFDEVIPNDYEAPLQRIVIPGYEKATLWCNASGDSMEPEISNGDKVALRLVEDFSFLPYGDIYGIITSNGMRTIKRLGKSDKDGYYRLIPTNKKYDEQDVPVAKIVRVFRVLGAIKSF